jgi:excisionase family DNA binding protein
VPVETSPPAHAGDGIRIARFFMRFLTVKQAAERLQVSAATVYQLCATRQLAHVRLGSGRGTIRIRDEDLAVFVARAMVQPAMPAAPKPTPLKLKP